MKIFKIKAIKKNIAPPKHGVINGFLAFTGHPLLHFFPRLQAINSERKLYQAKIVPASNTKN